MAFQPPARQVAALTAENFLDTIRQLLGLLPSLAGHRPLRRGQRRPERGRGALRAGEEERTSAAGGLFGPGQDPKLAAPCV